MLRVKCLVLLVTLGASLGLVSCATAPSGPTLSCEDFKQIYPNSQNGFAHWKVGIYKQVGALGNYEWKAPYKLPGFSECVVISDIPATKSTYRCTQEYRNPRNAEATFRRLRQLTAQCLQAAEFNQGKVSSDSFNSTYKLNLPANDWALEINIWIHDFNIPPYHRSFDVDYQVEAQRR